MKLDFYVAFLLIYMQLFACSFARGSEVKNIYLEKEEPIKDIVLYFSPKAQKILNKKYPQLYSEKPKWNFDLLTEVKIKGLMSDDDFKFYKYK